MHAPHGPGERFRLSLQTKSDNNLTEVGLTGEDGESVSYHPYNMQHRNISQQAGAELCQAQVKLCLSARQAILD